MYVWRVSLGEELPGCVYYQALVLVGMVVGWVVYCHARLDRGVGSPVYMVNQTTRHKVRMKRGEFPSGKKMRMRRNVFVPEAFYFVSGSCGGRAFAFSFIVFRTKLYNPPMYSCHHIYRWPCTFSVSAVTIMFCVRPKVALQCDIALCKRCTLAGLCNKKKKKLSLPGGAE